MPEEIVVIAPTLDTFIAERGGEHVEGGTCEYRLGRGEPLSKRMCSMCSVLSVLMDLSSSWTQKIDCGRLSGRSVEIIKTSTPRSWKIYRDCESAQIAARSCVLRRYYASFTCNGEHYTLRDTTIMHPPPVMTMIAQLVELCASLPQGFVHGNPTAASISFLGRLPVALKHTVPHTYFSRALLQVDYGAGNPYPLVIGSRQRVVDEPLGVIVIDTQKGIITIRSEASFASFLKEYPSHCPTLSMYFLLRGLLSFYTPEDTAVFAPITGSSCKTLREAFEEAKRQPIPLNLSSLLTRLVSAVVA